MTENLPTLMGENFVGRTFWRPFRYAPGPPEGAWLVSCSSFLTNRINAMMTLD
jgi:hypothetical protein